MSRILGYLVAVCALLLAAPTVLAGERAWIAPSSADEGADSAVGPLLHRAFVSETRATPEGQFFSRIYPARRFFERDGQLVEFDGSWIASPGEVRYRPKRAERPIALPRRLDEPIVLGLSDGTELRVRMRGTEAVRLSPSSGTYRGALAGVDLSYEARTWGLKELITLRNASAPASFTYDVRSSKPVMLSAKADGSYRLSTAGSEGAVAAPLAWDAAGAYTDRVEMRAVKRSSTHWVLVVTLSTEWLRADRRRYPVVVDPDYYTIAPDVTRFHGAIRDCEIVDSLGGSGAPGCDAPTLRVGAGPAESRALMRFDVNQAIPPQATIQAARVVAYYPGESQNPWGSLRIDTVSRAWTDAATWQSPFGDPGSAWGVPGGDLLGTTGSGSPTWVNNGGYWYYWEAPTASVQGWVAGTLPNHGFALLADQAPSGVKYEFTSTEGDQAFWPALDVMWTLPPGDQLVAPSDLHLDSLLPEGQAYLTLVEGANETGEITQVRYRVDGGAWTEWEDGPSPFIVHDLFEGAELDVEARTVDGATSSSTVASASFVAAARSASVAEDVPAAEYLQAEFGHTEAQAHAWLTLQEAGDKLAGRGGFVAPGVFGGLWFDNASRTVNLNVTRSQYDAALADEAEAQGIDRSRLVFRIVPYRESYLAALASVLEKELAAEIAGHTLEVEVRLSLGKVVIRLANDADQGAEDAVAAAVANTPGAIYVERVRRADIDFVPYSACRAGNIAWRPDDRRLFCRGELRGGNAVAFDTICTSGFLARRHGELGVTTSGHCTPSPASPVVDFERLLPEPGSSYILDGFRIGSSAHATVAYESDDEGPDAAIVEFASTRAARMQPWVLVLASPSSDNIGGEDLPTTRHEQYLIRQVGSAREGAIVCTTGASKRKTQCGNVYARGRRDNTHARIKGICGRGGDSGGPIYKNGVAYGMVSGGVDARSYYGLGSRECWVEFQGAESAEELLDMNILTASKWRALRHPGGGEVDCGGFSC